MLPQRSFRIRRLTIFMLALSIFGVLWVLPASVYRPLHSVLVTLTAPFENVFAWGAYELRSALDLWDSVGTLKAENEHLHQEVLRLQSDRALLVSLREENEALRREVGFEKTGQYTVITGEVLARNQGGQATTLRMNRGEQQGVKPGMPVITGGSVLVGRIESTTPFSSQVRLLSHTDSMVSVLVEGVSGEALLRGDHGIGLLLDLARPNEKIEAGKTVVTAGLDDGIPRGLLVGTIAAPRLSADQLFQQAIVIPPVRADNLRFLSIILASS